ncbi:unnamed protein product, partial [Schistocephalus solidus]|uniref:Secretory carrier-associated membrane protein n=1 Tax=Schistocephalus solidus TaxID=70667 RepID=A0A183T4C3_SCHSO
MYRPPPPMTNNQPAVLPLSDSQPLDPPPYSTSKSEKPALMPAAPAQDSLTVADLQRRQAELDARAAQLDLRERQQQQQEMWRAEHGYGNVTGNVYIPNFFLDSLKTYLKQLQINPVTWEKLARNRPAWRRTVKTGAAIFKANRIAAAMTKRAARKSPAPLTNTANAQALPICPRCQRTFRARIGLVGYPRTQCNNNPTIPTSTSTSVYPPSEPPLIPVPNWPPLPRGCCCRPCVRIDFNTDIPSQSRWLAKYAHYLWMAYSLVLFLDVFGALSYFIVSKTADSGPFFGVSILMAVILPPAAFFCWNRPLYKALKWVPCRHKVWKRGESEAPSPKKIDTLLTKLSFDSPTSITTREELHDLQKPGGVLGFPISWFVMFLVFVILLTIFTVSEIFKACNAARRRRQQDQLTVNSEVLISTPPNSPSSLGFHARLGPAVEVMLSKAAAKGKKAARNSPVPRTNIVHARALPTCPHCQRIFRVRIGLTPTLTPGINSITPTIIETTPLYSSPVTPTSATTTAF